MKVNACCRLAFCDLSANLDQRLKQAVIVGVDIVVVTIKRMMMTTPITRLPVARMITMLIQGATRNLPQPGVCYALAVAAGGCSGKPSHTAMK